MKRKQKRMLIRILITAAGLVVLNLVPVSGWFRLGAYLAVYLVIGYDILKKAGRGILNGRVFDENFLMAIATIGAFALAIYEGNGDYNEAIAVMLFYQIGELFQSYAVGKSRRNISSLMDIRPDYANIERDGQLEQVDPDEVEIGTVITVQPGEKVPIDGVVLEGHSSINTSALTGESIPRDINPEEEIISGCINLTGVLKVRTTRPFGESTVSKILALVEESGSRKSRSENFISRFARVYTPVVCICAAALAVLPPLIRLLAGMGPEWQIWIYRALTFLVISCPCALVVSIPLSFFAGIGGASREGILVKGSNYLEALSKTRVVVFDKTGTLTQGVFEVSGIHHDAETCERSAHAELHQAVNESHHSFEACEQSVHAEPQQAVSGSHHSFEACEQSAHAKPQQAASGQYTEEQKKLIEYAALAECASSHPISVSLRTAYGKEPDRSRVSQVEEISGEGVLAVVDGRNIAAGNSRLMNRLGISYQDCHSAGTIIHMAIDHAYAGHIVISDVEKANAAQAIQALKKAGVEKTVMLTGDLARVANQVAEHLGIDETRSELLPADKVAEVEKLLADTSMKRGAKLAFVGDGINDAPVLTRADIGIAMGAMGSDAAIEAADIVLMDDDPAKIAKALQMSRKCIRIVYENIIFALSVKFLCLVLGAVGVANMWYAIFADVGVMVLAVLNAIRALRTKAI